MSAFSARASESGGSVWDSKLATCAQACTPASVRPATVSLRAPPRTCASAISELLLNGPLTRLVAQPAKPAPW